MPTMGQWQTYGNQLCQLEQVLDKSFISLIMSAIRRKSRRHLPSCSNLGTANTLRTVFFFFCNAWAKKLLNFRRLAWRGLSSGSRCVLKHERDNRPPGLAELEGAFHSAALGELQVNLYSWFVIAYLDVLFTCAVMSVVCFLSIWSRSKIPQRVMIWGSPFSDFI